MAAAKARLILIRGEGMDGLSYHLKADQHLLGRQGQLEFPDDVFISPKHANFIVNDGKGSASDVRRLMETVRALAMFDSPAKSGLRTGAVDAPPARLPVRTHEVVIQDDVIHVVLSSAEPNLPFSARTV